MNQKIKMAAVLGALAMTHSIAVLAQSGPAKPQYEIGGGNSTDEDAPRGTQVGEGLYVFPYVKLGLGNNDNLFLTNGNEKHSSMSLLNPGLLLEGRRQNQLYRFFWDSKFGSYQSSSADNYQDHLLRGSGDFIFSSSAGLRLAYDFERGHDARGSTDRVFSATPDRFRNNGASALFAYGANQARARIEVEGGVNEKVYTNNRSSTLFGDRDTGFVRTTAYFRVMPKTSILAEYSYSDLDYAEQTSLLDSKEKRYMAGLTWEATVATSGTVKVGRLEKEFSSSLRSDFSGTSWEANVEWKPRSYSKLDLFAVKTINEASGIGDFILSKRAGAAWTHAWNSRLSTVASYTFTQDDFLGSNAVRKDEIDNFGVKVNYKLQRWLTLGADYTYTDRDSNISLYRYKRNLFMLTLGATL